MKIEKTLETPSLILRPITINDCNENYVNWLNDKTINQFLETRWQNQTLESIKDFVIKQINDNNTYLYAIIEKSTKQHIGNIKLGPINQNHQYADISYFIGEKSAWGKGYATEAIKAMINFGFSDLNLNSIQAGVYESNTGSIKALKKCGFKQCGVIKNQLNANSTREDHIFFSHELGRV